MTSARGINDSGQIVGTCAVPLNPHPLPQFFGRGILRSSGGVFTNIDDTSADTSLNGGGTYAHGINGTGQIVGTYSDASGYHGFLLSGGVFTSFDVPRPGAVGSTEANGLNDSGQIVGGYIDPNGFHGFLATPIPEPASLVLLGAGLLGLLTRFMPRRTV